MSAIMLMEWDNAKDERLKKYYERIPENQAFWQKKIEESVVKRTSSWSNGTGHVVGIIEFENMDGLSKLLSDQEYMEFTVKFFRNVDNGSIRILPQSPHVPPE